MGVEHKVLVLWLRREVMTKEFNNYFLLTERKSRAGRISTKVFLDSV